jgi:hypothetical protein
VVVATNEEEAAAVVPVALAEGMSPSVTSTIPDRNLKRLALNIVNRCLSFESN